SLSAWRYRSGRSPAPAPGRAGGWHSPARRRWKPAAGGAAASERRCSREDVPGGARHQVGDRRIEAGAGKRSAGTARGYGRTSIGRTAAGCRVVADHVERGELRDVVARPGLSRASRDREAARGKHGREAVGVHEAAGEIEIVRHRHGAADAAIALSAAAEKDGAARRNVRLEDVAHRLFGAGDDRSEGAAGGRELPIIEVVDDALAGIGPVAGLRQRRRSERRRAMTGDAGDDGNGLRLTDGKTGAAERGLQYPVVRRDAVIGARSDDGQRQAAGPGVSLLWGVEDDVGAWGELDVEPDGGAVENRLPLGNGAEDAAAGRRRLQAVVVGVVATGADEERHRLIGLPALVLVLPPDAVLDEQRPHLTGRQDEVAAENAADTLAMPRRGSAAILVDDAILAGGRYRPGGRDEQDELAAAAQRDRLAAVGRDGGVVRGLGEAPVEAGDVARRDDVAIACHRHWGGDAARVADVNLSRRQRRHGATASAASAVAVVATLGVAGDDARLAIGRAGGGGEGEGAESCAAHHSNSNVVNGVEAVSETQFQAMGTPGWLPAPSRQKMSTGSTVQDAAPPTG